jgi:hypothetical protein
MIHTIEEEFIRMKYELFIYRWDMKRIQIYVIALVMLVTVGVIVFLAVQGEQLKHYI